MTTVALRTALVWQDEVMDDVVVHQPTKITVGHIGKPTFVVPDVGLPKNFAIVRPGNRGYLLTLGDRMRGTICIDGERKDVAEFVRRGGDRDAGPGGFRATPISGKDWGVIDLDESGDYKLFFQFVPVEDAEPFLSRPVLLAGLAGYLLSIAALTVTFWLSGVTADFMLLDSEAWGDLAECAFRGWGLSSIALAIAAAGYGLLREDSEQQASFAFSVLLHAALLFMTYELYDGTDPFAWPGPRALTANYLATRLEPHQPPEPVPAATGAAVSSSPAAAKSKDPPKQVATKTAEGASGGKGDTERARDPRATDAPVAPPPKVGLMTDKNRGVMDQIDQNLKTSVDKFANAMKGEYRAGSLGLGESKGGTGVGNDGPGTGTTRGSQNTGTGADGKSEGEYVTKKKALDTGKEHAGGGDCAKPPCGIAPKEVTLKLQQPDGDFGGLTAEEINRVVKARAGIFRACYQTELNRSPGIGGKLIVNFQIGGDGAVKGAKIAGSSALRNAGVESCVKNNIMRLKFPAKGGVANVNYPFLFQPGG